MPTVISCISGNGSLDRATLGVLGAGQRLATQLDGKHAVLLIGSPMPESAAELRRYADSVQLAEHPLLSKYNSEITLSAVAQACGLLKPDVVLLANDTYSQELTPRLAYRLSGSSASDALSLDVKDGKILVNRLVYGGKAQATIVLRSNPAVIWIRARAMAPAEPKESLGEIGKLTLSLVPDERIKIISQQTENRSGEARLEDARFIVSGGRGLGGPEPFKLLQELAKVMGAHMAASRAACDAGWVPPTWQVGQTGKKVAPELYLAVAVSGASQHLMGIADAKVVAAINTDRDAPIFSRSRFGLVEDYRNVVGLLQKKLSELRP